MQKPRVIPMNYAAFVVVGDLLKMTRKQVFSKGYAISNRAHIDYWVCLDNSHKIVNYE